MTQRWIVVGLGLLLFACGDDDGAPRPDAPGGTPDGPRVDATLFWDAPALGPDAAPPDAALPDATPSVCGDGVVTGSESCDVALAPPDPGACPTSCPDDGDPCTVADLVGSGCTRRCETTTITTAISGDGCCPAGVPAVDDTDCPLLTPAGDPQIVCAGSYQWPTVASGGDRIAVGCVPDGSQNVTPVVKFRDGLGYPLAETSLLTADGYYYTDIDLRFANAGFEAVYEYNCDDNGSWNVGWGWGCIDFRAWTPGGAQLVGPRVFGETGHNGHPVIDWSGAEYGVAWVSYDDFYFRRLDANGQLLDGGPLDNLLVGPDPYQPDQRNGARTKIVWDPDTASFGTFDVSGYRMFFSRVTAGAAVTLAPVEIGPAYSQTFGGQLDVAYVAGAYRVVYLHPTTYDLELLTVAANGTHGSPVLVQDSPYGSSSYVHPSLVAKDGLLYVFTNDHGTATARLHVLQPDGTPVREGVLLPGTDVVFPSASYDPTNGTFAVVFNDTFNGNVLLGLFSE